MERSMETLLEGIIDYAGIFPPAKLAMKPAVEEFLEIAQGDSNWLVNRFAVGASRLDELRGELEKHLLEETIPISVIGTAADAHHWPKALQHDLEAMKAFTEAVGDRAEIEAYEARVPHSSYAEEALRLLKPLETPDVFLELPWDGDMEDALAAVAGSQFAAAKARTGGADASAFPSSLDLAGFIQQCLHAELPFKLTAGLHHPLPKVDPATGGRMHGFLNVVVATALCYAEDLSVRELEAILDEHQASNFRFGPNSLSWHGFEADEESIEAAREFFLSFGSCSVSEPVADLALLGWKD